MEASYYSFLYKGVTSMSKKVKISKEKKLYHLRAGISGKSEHLKYLLKNIIQYSESEAETQSMADLALDEVNRIAKMSKKIGRILKH